MTLQSLINHWLLPDYTMNVPAFCMLKAPDVRNMKRGRQKLHEMGKVMSRVEQVGREREVWINDNGKWDVDTVSQMYFGIVEAFNIPGQGRSNQVSWYTVFRHFIVPTLHVIPEDVAEV